MTITVSNLHKRLCSLIESGHGRKPVVVDKSSFTHNCEGDGITILDLAGLGIVCVPQGDGDGAIKVNKDGTESCRTCLVLVGSDKANLKGDIVPNAM